MGESLFRKMATLNTLDGIRGMHFVHINIRSLFPKIDLLRHSLENSKVSICGVSESWLNEKMDSGLVDCKGYKVERLDRSWHTGNRGSPKKGGGVCTYFRDTITYSAQELSNLNQSTSYVEAQWFTIRQPNQKKIIMANIYRPPQGQVANFSHYLDECLNRINFNGSELLLLMGDFNIDYLDKNNPKTSTLNSWIKSKGLRQHIEGATRVTKDKQSCLDLIISNFSDIAQYGTLNYSISDHDMVFITKKKTCKIKVKTNFIGRSYRNLDNAVFVERLKAMNWETFDNENDVNKAWEIMFNYIKKTADELCPLKHFRIAQVKEAWITCELLEMIKEKDSALARAKRTKSENDFQRARQLRNEVIRRLRTARADYIKNNLQESRGDTKKFWKNISDILPARKSSQRNSIRLTNQTSNDTIPEHECADYINSFFTSIGPELSRTFNTTWKYDSKILRETMADLDCTEEEILKLIRSIDIGKSSGIQGISSRILKIALVGIVDKLTTLFKRSLSSVCLPRQMETSQCCTIGEGGQSDKCF